MTINSNQTPGSFLQISQRFSEQEDQRLIQHTQLQSDTARYLNTREIATYDLVMIQTGQQWFNPASTMIKRYGFRQVYQVSDASLTITHGIPNLTLCTYIGGGFTDGTLFYPLPYVSAVSVANQIQINVSATQIIVTKGGAAPAITSGVIVLEFLQQ